ncbi:hypothetical protein HPB47_014461 [Ixodes persulcatus]|uniref:Uncharacterized protein n=1 Tax=Ixodes persulcatus TaxID=34615 RepID=A0AC60QYE1_IXOPE|nr:hypothetical protein HPB47_014461 [Ixodes persulcatus]
MEGDQEQTFSSVEEELRYYKDLAEKYKAKRSSGTTRWSSRTQLKQYETSDRELRSLLGRVQSENDSLQERLSQVQAESTRQVSDLQNQLADVTASREEMHRYIRELDAVHRRSGASQEAIERNAFLENELDEKEALGFMVQRLKDETRDLKQELMIQQSVHKEEQTPFPDNGTSGLAKFEAAYKARKEAQAAAAAGVAGANAVPCTPGRRRRGPVSAGTIVAVSAAVVTIFKLNWCLADIGAYSFISESDVLTTSERKLSLLDFDAGTTDDPEPTDAPVEKPLDGSSINRRKFLMTLRDRFRQRLRLLGRHVARQNQTDGSALHREQIAAHIRELLIAAPFDLAEGLAHGVLLVGTLGSHAAPQPGCQPTVSVVEGPTTEATEPNKLVFVVYFGVPLHSTRLSSLCYDEILVPKRAALTHRGTAMFPRIPTEPVT